MNKFSSTITYEKPRRLEEETIQYLIQLDEQFTQQIQQLSSSSSTSTSTSTSKFPPHHAAGTSSSPSNEEQDDLNMIKIFINNVLDEIKFRLASTICEKRTNYLLERICSYSNIEQLMEIMKRCQEYIIFLAQNRYGSHVVQAILSRLCFLFKNNQIEEVEEDILESTILSFIQPLLNSFKYLATEISGSHVLRSVLCLLSGLPCISEKKGKSSKHQHAVSLSEPLDSLLVTIEPGKAFTSLKVIDSRKCFPVPSSFHEALTTAAQSLLVPTASQGTTQSTVRASRELQELVANTTSCAALTVLLRILFSPHIIPGGEEVALQVVKCVFEFDAPIDSVDGDLCAVVFYAMGGDKSGSYFMEVVIDCARIEFVSDLLSRGLTLESDPYTLVDQFARDNVGNYVLQSILKRLHREMMCISTSFTNKLTFSVENPEIKENNQRIALTLATKLLSGESLCHSSLYLPYLCEDPNRGGIVLWLLQLAQQIHEILSIESSSRIELLNSLHIFWIKPFTSSTMTTKAISRADELALSLLSVWAGQTEKYLPWEETIPDFGNYWDSNDFTSNLNRTLSTKLVNIPHTPASGGAAAGAGGGGGKNAKKENVPPAGDENQQSIVNLTARLIGAILAMDSSLSCRVISKAISRLPADILLPICYSGPISRCIMDPFFLSKSNGRERSTLLTSFILPNLSSLSTHPIGHHVIRRCYESLTSVDKERLLDGMNSSSTFSGPSSQSREIKSLISTVHLDVYRSGISEWRALISKQKKAEIMLAELEKTSMEMKNNLPVVSTKKTKKKEPLDEIDEIFPAEEKKKTTKKERNVETSSSIPTSTPSSQSHKSSKVKPTPTTTTTTPATTATLSSTELNSGNDDEKKRKRKRKRASTTTGAPSSATSHASHASHASTSHSRHQSPSHSNSHADMDRIRHLQSGKMISIKRITEELENDLVRKKKRDG